MLQGRRIDLSHWISRNLYAQLFWGDLGELCNKKGPDRTRLVVLAHPTGFEPVTSAFGGQRSIQLSYGCLFKPYMRQGAGMGRRLV